MIYAIIAAGQGSRLAGEGITLPKPLVRVSGVPLIERLALIMASRHDCEGLEIIVSEEGGEVRHHLESLKINVPLHVTVKTTPGSMHSLAALAPRLRDKAFCLATVDAVFHPEEFDAYADAFGSGPECDALMAVTTYLDDEKPLYVAVTPEMEITGFFDTPASGSSYVSGGIYILKPSTLSLLDECMSAGLTRMRDFQRSLVAAGMRLRAFQFSRIIDVDHISDIAAAEALTNHKPIQSQWPK